MVSTARQVLPDPLARMASMAKQVPLDLLARTARMVSMANQVLRDRREIGDRRDPT
jgi:hypothetical protein